MIKNVFTMGLQKTLKVFGIYKNLCINHVWNPFIWYIDQVGETMAKSVQEVGAGLRFPGWVFPRGNPFAH
jgi:hypothetical protein